MAATREKEHGPRSHQRLQDTDPRHPSNLIAILHASREYGQERARSRPRESVALHSQDVTPSPDRERAAGFPPPPVGTTRLSRDYLPLCREDRRRRGGRAASPGSWQIEAPATRPNTSKPGTVIERYATKEKGPPPGIAGVSLLELTRARRTNPPKVQPSGAPGQALLEFAVFGVLRVSTTVVEHIAGTACRGAALNLRIGPIRRVDSRGVHDVQLGDRPDGQAVAATRHVAEAATRRRRRRELGAASSNPRPEAPGK